MASPAVVAAAGITGGMTSGGAYFAIEVGSSDPPGSASGTLACPYALGLLHGERSATTSRAARLHGVYRESMSRPPALRRVQRFRRAECTACAIAAGLAGRDRPSLPWESASSASRLAASGSCG